MKRLEKLMAMTKPCHLWSQGSRKGTPSPLPLPPYLWLHHFWSSDGCSVGMYGAITLYPGQCGWNIHVCSSIGCTVRSPLTGEQEETIKLFLLTSCTFCVLQGKTVERELVLVAEELSWSSYYSTVLWMWPWECHLTSRSVSFFYSDIGIMIPLS